MQAVKKYIYALSVFCGTIIGVGLFGLPYVASKIGFIPTLAYFAIFGVVATISVLMFGELTCRTNGMHRLPGYSKIYLGPKFKVVTTISQIIGMSGAILAYIIVGGSFLSSLLQPFFGGQEVVYLFLYFVAGAFLIYLNSKNIARMELIMLVFIFIVMGFLVKFCWPHISFSNFSNTNFKYFFLPYGMILFSIWGASIVPELKDILRPKNLNLLKPVIISGIIISIIVYILFIFAILGVTGENTTVDALGGLQKSLSNRATSIFLIFGILTTFTSYITLGLTFKKVFWYDLKLPHLTSWLIVILIPPLLFFLGITNFIIIISFIGAVTLGIDTIIIFLSYLKSKTMGQVNPPYSLSIPSQIVYVFIGMFVLGIVLELITIKIH